YEAPLVMRLTARLAALQPAEHDARLNRGLFDLAQQVVDRFVARRRDADALAACEQVDDQARTGVGLAGAGRPLDEEVAALDPLDEPLRLFERRDLDAFAAEGRLPVQHRLERGVAPGP